MRIAVAKVLGFVFLMSLVSAPLAEAQGLSEAPVTLLVQEVPGVGPEQAPAVLIVDGEILTLYVNPQGRIAFRREADSHTLDDDTERPGGKHVRLYYDGHRLYALWWQKLANGGKHLYLRASADKGKTFGPVVTLNSATGVLPTYDVAYDGAGHVAVAYHDERKLKYQIYLNRSDDGGKTWLKQDIRLDSAPWTGKDKKKQPPFAVEPKLVFQGKNLIAAWKEKRAGADGKPYFRVVSRSSGDGGRTWAPEVEIRRDDRGFLSSELLLSHGDQVFLIGFQAGQGLLAYRLATEGRSWELLGSLPDSDKVTALSQIEAVPRGDDLLVVYTLEQEKKKSQVHLASLAFGTGKWAAQTSRLDRTPLKIDLTKALNPDMAVLQDGTVVVVWQDYRNIRPNIYIDYTRDGGRTWQPEPRPIEEPGRYLSEYPHLATRDGQLLVFFDRFRDDARQKRDYVYRPLTYSADSGIAGLPDEVKPLSKEEKERRLTERVKQFWTLRTEGKFTETYDFFDPVFRAQTSRETFNAHQGNIVYEKFDVRDVGSWGNLADVVIKMTFAVPEMQVMGQKVKVDKREETMHSEWVWVYDNWYTVFRSPFGNRYLNY